MPDPTAPRCATRCTELDYDTHPAGTHECARRRGHAIRSQDADHICACGHLWEPDPTAPVTADDRHPLDALAEVDCPHTRHHAMCAQCAADAVRPELERLRTSLTEASDALRDVGKAVLTVAPTLRQPYRDAPETSPWEQFVKQPARRAYTLGVRIRRQLKEEGDRG
jgi:hypothetical protein